MIQLEILAEERALLEKVHDPAGLIKRLLHGAKTIPADIGAYFAGFAAALPRDSYMLYMTKEEAEVLYDLVTDAGAGNPIDVPLEEDYDQMRYRLSCALAGKE